MKRASGKRTCVNVTLVKRTSVNVTLVKRTSVNVTLIKLQCLLLGQLTVEIWLLLILRSGHTRSTFATGYFNEAPKIYEAVSNFKLITFLQSIICVPKETNQMLEI